MESKKWNKLFDACVECKKTDFKFKGHGLCIHCYNRSDFTKQNKARWKASGKGKYWYHANDQRLRTIAISHYSNGKNCCALCGFNDIRALTIDHIDNNGNEHRKTFNTTINAWLHTHNYPDCFQVLCCNCNWIKEVERRKSTSNYFLNK